MINCLSIVKTGWIPVTARFSRLFWAVIGGCLLTAQFAYAENSTLHLVLVTSVSSSINVLNRNQIRKIYLGSPLAEIARPIQPLINHSNGMLHEMFLQKVLFMSTKAYERHVRDVKPSSRAVLPISYRSESRLIAYLKLHPDSIAFLTEQKAAQLSSLKVVSRL